MRLADRLSTASGSGENGRNTANSYAGEQGWPQKQASSRDDAGGRRVVIEPKPRKGLDPEPRGHGMAPEASQGFEPIPPAKTMRPPRRPLTFQDFPELSQTAPAKNGAPEGRNPSKQRGFFDWMAGRVRNSDKSESRSAAGKTVVLKPRSPGERENYGEESARQQGGVRGNQELGRGRGDPGDADPHQGLSSDESIEIPDFFKKPLT
jgi:cell division protein FtsZ